MGVASEVRTSSIPPLHATEAETLYAELVDSMVTLLRSLDARGWEAQTECELWRVRDMIAHLTGWNEAFASLRELGRQGSGAFRRRKEFGNVVDAQNQVQVDERRDLTTDELLSRFTKSAVRGAARRRAISRSIGRLPIYVPYLGGWITLSYLNDITFTRDVFVHRIDISRAVDTEYKASPADQRVFDDIVRDWFARSKARARLRATGELRGEYVSDDPAVATLSVDGVGFTRMLFGRTGKDVVSVEGDVQSGARWLDTYFPV